MFNPKFKTNPELIEADVKLIETEQKVIEKNPVKPKADLKLIKSDVKGKVVYRSITGVVAYNNAGKSFIVLKSDLGDVPKSWAFGRGIV